MSDFKTLCFEPFLRAYSACHQLSLMKCDTVSNVLVPHEGVKLTVESFCLPEPCPKHQPPNGWPKRIFRVCQTCRGSESLYCCLFCVCRRVVILMDLDVLKTADKVGGNIGNPVPYNEGECPL